MSEYNTPVEKLDTYLQLMVEWGSINTLIFIGYLFFTYFKVPNNKVKPYQVKSIKNILFVLCARHGR